MKLLPVCLRHLNVSVLLTVLFCKCIHRDTTRINIIANTLYIGGEAGNDMAMMFHKYPLESGAKHIGNGIYLGGLKNAKELVAARKAHPKDFKFIFNYSVWPKGSLEKEIAEGKWDILTCPPDFLIREESTSLWSRCRAKLRSLGKLRSTTTEHDGEDD